MPRLGTAESPLSRKIAPHPAWFFCGRGTHPGDAACGRRSNRGGAYSCRPAGRSGCAERERREPLSDPNDRSSPRKWGLEAQGQQEHPERPAGRTRERHVGRETWQTVLPDQRDRGLFREGLPCSLLCVQPFCHRPRRSCIHPGQRQLRRRAERARRLQEGSLGIPDQRESLLLGARDRRSRPLAQIPVLVVPASQSLLQASVTELASYLRIEERVLEAGAFEPANLAELFEAAGLEEMEEASHSIRVESFELR